MAVDRVPGRQAFERAVGAYALDEIRPPPRCVEVASSSLERTGLFVLGELHGVAETPRAILGLVTALGIRALAFEWSHDELDPVVQPVLRDGSRASDVLWRLPPSAEVFSGDGRFTAGHVRLLEHLAGRLDRIVLLDRVGSSGPEREAGMAERLLAGRCRDSPLLAVLGADHVLREPLEGLEPLGLLVERRLPGVANSVLVASSGNAWFHGERELLPQDVSADAVIPIGVASPAIVPRHDAAPA